MSKRKATSTVPAAVQDAISSPAKASEPTAAKQPNQKLPRAAIIEVPVGEVPLGELDDGYLPRHVEVRIASASQREALRRLHRGLVESGEKLDDGKRVASNADAIRWLLDRIAVRS